MPLCDLDCGPKEESETDSSGSRTPESEPDPDGFNPFLRESDVDIDKPVVPEKRDADPPPKDAEPPAKRPNTAAPEDQPKDKPIIGGELL